MKEKSIAILYICTGQYVQLWEDFYKCCSKYFLPECKKTYFIFSDTEITGENIEYTYVPWKPWPYSTLYRYEFFLQQRDKIEEHDYCFFFNANAEILKTIHLKEIAPSPDEKLVAAESYLHCRLNDEQRLNHLQKCYWSNRPKSSAFIPFTIWEQNPKWGWLMGGFNGGETKAFMEMALAIKECIEEDKLKNIHLKWNDEAYMNWYMLNHSVKRLNPKLYLCFYNGQKLRLKYAKIIVKRKNNLLPADFRHRPVTLTSLTDRLTKFRYNKQFN